MARSNWKLHQQLVLDQCGKVEIPACHQDVLFQFLVQRSGGFLIGDESKPAVDLDPGTYRRQAALARQGQLDTGPQVHPRLGPPAGIVALLALRGPFDLQAVRWLDSFCRQALKTGQGLGAGHSAIRLRELSNVQPPGHKFSFHPQQSNPHCHAASGTIGAMQKRTVILASTSRYRRELMNRLRLPFEVHSPEVDETPLAGESPSLLAERLALAKAQAVASRFPEAVVIGSDQVADLRGEALGKPGTHDRATEQLRRMRGQTLVFQTAVAVVCKATGFQQRDIAPVRVVFRQLDDAAIEAYLQAEQPYDCAGSAKSEGLGIALLEAIDSDDPTALVGLPLIRTCRMLRSAGVDLL